MTFTIHQQVFDRDGMPLEKKANQYKEQLIQLFEQSPEGLALWSADIEPGWAGMLLDFGTDYLGVTPPQMSPDDVREILFDLIPRKVSAPAEEAPEIIHELRAFWIFLQREFHLENATACLRVLNEQAVRELKEKMSDPATFGIAKSFVMMGMATYNAELTAGAGLPLSLHGERSEQAQQFHNTLKPQTTRGKRKRTARGSRN